MRVAEQPVAQRQLFTLRDGKIHGLDIAEHFRDIQVGVHLRVWCEDVLKRTLRAFYL